MLLQRTATGATADAGDTTGFASSHARTQYPGTRSQEDVQVLGLSVLSGAHVEMTREILTLLANQQVDDMLIVLGGIIPEQDRSVLKEMGVYEVFGPGTTTEEIVNCIKEAGKTVL